MTREEFIKEVTEGLLPPPVYFPQNVQMNKQGYDSIAEVLQRGAHPLSPAAFEAAANETGALILDTRDPDVFVKGFIPNSINIGLDGMFAPWVGALVPDVKQEILLVTDEGKEEEAVIRLARVGYDHVLGYLQGSFNAWKAAGKETDTISSITAEAFANRYRNEDVEVVDVRRKAEYDAGHIRNAINLPLDYINDQMKDYAGKGKIHLHCAGGYRSVIAASILKARGIENVVNISGGFAAISATGLLRDKMTA